MADQAPHVTLFDSNDAAIGQTVGNPIITEITDGTNILGTAAHPVRVDPTGTTTQPVSNTALQLGQGSTTAGQTGPLVQGAVTSAAPSYTNGQTDPLSLTTAGALRVDGSATTQPVSGTVTANQGTAAALAGHWPVQVTDGTNTLPTGDAPARKIYTALTDGTNTAAVDGTGALKVTFSGSPTSVFRVDFGAGTSGSTNTAVTTKTYYELIQASNASTDFKHTAGTKIKLHKLIASMFKSKMSDEWDVEVGTVLATTGTNVTIGWLQTGTMRIRDTGSGSTQQQSNLDFESDLLDLTTSAGDYTKIGCGSKQTTTDLTNASTIADFAGTLVTPVAGDLIMRVSPVGGVSGNLIVEQHIAYEVLA